MSYEGSAPRQPRPPRPEAEPGTKVYVGNLPWSCDPQSLREEFSQFGNVTDCFIPRDRETGRPRGFGFVTFDTTDSANSSVESMNGKEYGGRTLKVNLAQGR